MAMTLQQQQAVAIAQARKLQAEAKAKPADVRGTGMGAGSSLEAGLIALRQGGTAGFGDNINAASRAAMDWIGNPLKLGDGKPFRESYDNRLAHERAVMGEAKAEFPGVFLANELTGSLLLPGGTAKSLPGAVGTAAGFGALSGAGNADEKPMLPEMAKGAALGGGFGLGAGMAIKGATKGFNTIMGRVAEQPTVEGLRQATREAYRAVDDAGEVFLPEDLQAMAKAAREGVDSLGNYVPDVDNQTRAALTILERNTVAPLSLGKLDKIRQGMWKRLEAAPNEVGIHEVIDAIDNLVQSRTDSSDLMTAARMANAQYKRAELLADAFKLAENQTKSSGSGGNILNKYKQAVTKIVGDKKKAKWFEPEQLAAMQHVIDGNVSQRVLRRVGKISPSGNGLMLMLNLLGASTVGPAFLPITALGAGAKELADRSAGGDIDALMGRVMGGAAPAPTPLPGMNAAGYLGGSSR